MLRGPGSVGVDPQSLLRRCIANDADDLHVAVGTQLDLENWIIASLGDASFQLVIFGNRDREARLRRRSRIEPPHSVHGQAELLPHQVV